MKESMGTLRKATVTSAGELKEELVDRAPVLIDKAEVMQVINIELCYSFVSSFYFVAELSFFLFSKGYPNCL
jgi:hypothetical protein